MKQLPLIFFFLLISFVPVQADYVINDFETDSIPWSSGTLVEAFSTSGTHSLRLDLPGSAMWYYSATIIDIGQLDSQVRLAAFSDATKLIIDFTYTQYTADWYADHDVGFILQGTGAENDWMELNTKVYNGFGVTTTAEILLTPGQANILAVDPAAKLFLLAHYGNGNDMGATLYLDTFRTDAEGTFTQPLELLGAQIESASSIALLTIKPVDIDASASSLITLQSATDTAYSSALPVSIERQGDKAEILLLNVPAELSPGNDYTLAISGLKGQGGEEQHDAVQYQFSMGDEVRLSVDSLAISNRISPYIYGMSFAPSSEYMRRGGITVNRWGGNAVSAFNWEQNTTNRAADWYFLNSPIDHLPDEYIADNAAGGALTQWTLATLPWVAKDSFSYSFSVAKYGAQEQASGDAGNGRTSGGTRIVNDFTDAYVPNRPRFSEGDDPDTIYQDEFLQYIDARLGGFTRKVPFIAIDNEVDIWDGTHADAVHSPMTYDDILENFTAYATMVREEIPDVQIFGPVSTGWFFYWNSAQGGERASKGIGNIPWFLQQVKAHDDNYGQRTLDVLDLHYYPEAGFSTEAGPTDIDAWRLRSTREWWDASYRAEGSFGTESWWAPGEPNQYNPQVIPRMKTLIDTYYPGTKLGFSEWNWGHGLSAALATADTLGIFGKYGLYYSTIWDSPGMDDPTYQSFCLFRNPDDSGRGFGSLSLPASSPNLDQISIFASLSSKGDRLHVIMINKDHSASHPCSIELPSITSNGTLEAFRFDEMNRDRVISLPGNAVVLDENDLSIVLPPYSAVHVMIPIVADDSDNDGMADVWEELYSNVEGSISALNSAVVDAAVDNDHDGFDNFSEFLAGTDPQDRTSFPQSYLQNMSDDSYLLGAFAPYDRTVLLQKSSDMSTWETVYTVSGTDGWVEIPVVLSSSDKEFFRVEIR